MSTLDTYINDNDNYNNNDNNNNIYIKQNVLEHEYKMHKHVYDLQIVNIPRIISYNKDTKIMCMDKIDALNLSDMHGEKDSDLDEYYFDEIRTIIKNLVKHNIEYPDITGYNFIEYESRIWIIDFEHSDFIINKMKDKFVDKFVNGLNKWNPRFK